MAQLPGQHRVTANDSIRKSERDDSQVATRKQLLISQLTVD
jgi:hypothetical protein